MATEGFEIRAMESADVPVAIALAKAQGWRDRTRFYDFVMRVATCQPVVGTVGDRLVATGLATANGSVGWLSAIVVDAEFRRRGFGRAVTEELMRRLEAAGCATLSLEATEAGRPMYERLGFRLVSHYHQLQADQLAERPAPPEGTRIRRLEKADLPAVLELDRLATAEDRSAPLTVLADWGGWVLEGETARARDDEPARGLRGFLFPTERAHGAIVAPRFEDGLFLLDLHRHIVPEGAHVRAGVPDEHDAGWRQLEAHGWRETWRAPRMILGPAVLWRPEWIWGQISSGMG